jgi:hypothetical protein
MMASRRFLPVYERAPVVVAGVQQREANAAHPQRSPLRLVRQVDWGASFRRGGVDRLCTGQEFACDTGRWFLAAEAL